MFNIDELVERLTEQGINPEEIEKIVATVMEMVEGGEGVEEEGIVEDEFVEEEPVGEEEPPLPEILEEEEEIPEKAAPHPFGLGARDPDVQAETIKRVEAKYAAGAPAVTPAVTPTSKPFSEPRFTKDPVVKPYAGQHPADVISAKQAYVTPAAAQKPLATVSPKVKTSTPKIVGKSFGAAIQNKMTVLAKAIENLTGWFSTSQEEDNMVNEVLNKGFDPLIPEDIEEGQPLDVSAVLESIDNNQIILAKSIQDIASGVAIAPVVEKLGEIIAANVALNKSVLIEVVKINNQFVALNKKVEKTEQITKAIAMQEKPLDFYKMVKGVKLAEEQDIPEQPLLVSPMEVYRNKFNDLSKSMSLEDVNIAQGYLANRNFNKVDEIFAKYEQAKETE